MAKQMASQTARQMVKNLMIQLHLTTQDICNCCPHGINSEGCELTKEGVEGICPHYELGLVENE